ncbi:mannose-1-phosphate guanylyltransferase/mannose-6-phosphate isomerase [Oceanibaculum pacificum]|uniref:mannose-1-phosphate guanylyltransferase n=1 Tax=Oceanibaculum pacificum TaxID=580166 RepID=A0A154WF37_9PROT|nr:mannose-1-phosphate guanylyltransferase/mannose-6-phosphate isomerase [Oceanibaculum pacificum]KZD12075.1 mannose-1-phosphate guanyltransferase [Oceanibaculum pacificum]
MRQAEKGFADIIPVILSGGTGSRLWPVSRLSYPKQFLPLISERSLIQETALRIAPSYGFAPPIVVCSEDHRFIVAEQMRQIDIEPAAILLEPQGRNTAPALTAAALVAQAAQPDAVLLVLPADHFIGDEDGLRQAVLSALEAAREGYLGTFGMKPTEPATGYGYVKPGAAIAGHCHRVERFVEKPDRATAERFVAEGYLWNSGMFLLPVAAYLREVEQHAPEVLATTRQSVTEAKQDLTFLRLGPSFRQAPSISVDYAVMERTDKAAVTPASVGWADLGSWSSLWEVGDKDADGNVVQGDGFVIGATNSFVRASGIPTVAIGVDNIVVVAMEDAVLVVAKDHVQQVKDAVTLLKQDGRSEADTHRRIYRPWGYYQTLHMGERFQVKRLTVNPGGKLSLQKHFHRAEHWVVVNGTALVTRDSEQTLLRENESIYLPLGSVHRLENPGRVELNLIEVQSGSYLGEDDIVRIEDVFGRV